MSPFATTGILTAAFTAAMVSYSASPRYRSARVRPCTVSIEMPAASARRATVIAFLCSRSQPVRIFSVTGTASGPVPTAATTASTMRCTSGSFCSSAEPAATLQTFFAGQPMLMSMICAPLSTL